MSIGRGGSTGRTYSDSDTVSFSGDAFGGIDVTEGFDFTFSTSVTGNQLQFTARTEGAIGISLSDLSSLGDAKTGSVIVTPQLGPIQEILEGLAGQVNVPGLNIGNEVRSAISNSPQFEFIDRAPGRFGGNLQSLREVVSIPMQSKAAIRLPFIGSVRSIGNDPEVNSVSFNIDRVPVPDIPAVREAAQRVDPVVIEARFKPDSTVANALSNVTQTRFGAGTAVVEIEIPPAAFLDYRELGANVGRFGACLEAASNGDALNRNAKDVARRVGSIVSRTDNISERFFNTLGEARDDALDNLVSEAELGLEGVAQQVEGAAEDVQQAASDLEDELPSEDELRQRVSSGDDLSDLVDDPPSRTELTSALSSGESIRNLLIESAGDVRGAVSDASEGISRSDNPVRDRLTEVMPEELLKGASPRSRILSGVGTGGQLKPKDIIDASYLLERVVCEGESISDLEQGRVLDYQLGVAPEIAEAFNETIFSVFESGLGEFEAVAEDIRDLERDVRNEFGTGTECRFLFEDLVQNLRGCANFSLGSTRITVPRGDVSLPDGGLPAIASGGNFPTLAEAFGVAMGFDAQKEEKERERTGGGGGGTVGGGGGPQQLNCADIALRIRNRVNDIEEQSQRLEDKNPFEFDFKRVVNLRNDIQSVRSRIKTEVSSANPCKNQLQSRLQTSRSRLENIRDVNPEDLPCTTKNPDAEEAVSQFESLAAEPSQTIRELGEGAADLDELRDEVGDDIDFEQLVKAAGENQFEIETGSVVETIEDNAEGDCVDYFLSRVEQAENEIERSVQGLSINRDLLNRRAEARQQALEDIRSRVTDQEEVEQNLQQILERAGKIQQAQDIAEGEAEGGN